VSDIPTPRTDAAERTSKACNQSDSDQSWPWDAIKRGYNFARQLEREFAEVTKQRDEWFEAMKLQTKKLGDAQEQLKEALDLCAKWEEEHAACLKTAEESANLAEQAMRQRDALEAYAKRAKDAAEELDWNDHNSVFNYATHRKTDAINSLATLEGGGE
jgi:exonuclease VII large subunit